MMYSHGKREVLLVLGQEYHKSDMCFSHRTSYQRVHSVDVSH